MTIIAACAALHNTRSGGALYLLIAGAVLGFGEYFIDNMISAFGEAGTLPPVLSAWGSATLGAFLWACHAFKNRRWIIGKLVKCLIAMAKKIPMLSLEYSQESRMQNLFFKALSKPLLASIALLSTAMLPVSINAQTSHGIEAVVNDDVITTFDLQQRAMFMIATQGIKATEEVQKQVLAQAMKKPNR